MKRDWNLLRILTVFLIASPLACASPQADEAAPEPQPTREELVPDPLMAPVPDPVMESLGDGRYRIGQIIVDKVAGEFTVPGKVLHLTGPLEYLAVSLGGMKEYESLLELSTTARNFNLACILIGLDDKNSVKPRYQFDDRKAEGQSVSITIAWDKDGETIEVSAANAMTAGEEVFEDDDWVYIGSETSGDNQQFMADMGGTLIGIVHDPYSVIDHGSGAGMGSYGMMTANPLVLPPEGALVSLTVTVVPE